MLTTIAVALIAFPLAPPADAQTPKQCPVGVYRFDDGNTMDVAPADDNALRWMTFTGERGLLHPEPNGGWTSTFGWTTRPDGKKVSFAACGAGQVTFENLRGRRV